MRKSARIAGTSTLVSPGVDSKDTSVRPPPAHHGDVIAPTARRTWGYPAPVFTSFEWCLPDD
jgi:hypothetical protein